MRAEASWLLLSAARFGRRIGQAALQSATYSPAA